MCQPLGTNALTMESRSLEQGNEDRVQEVSEDGYLSVSKVEDHGPDETIDISERRMTERIEEDCSRFLCDSKTDTISSSGDGGFGETQQRLHYGESLNKSSSSEGQEDPVECQNGEFVTSELCHSYVRTPLVQVSHSRECQGGGRASEDEIKIVYDSETFVGGAAEGEESSSEVTSTLMVDLGPARISSTEDFTATGVSLSGDTSEGNQRLRDLKVKSLDLLCEDNGPKIETLKRKNAAEVSVLVEEHLSDLYAPFETVGSQLIRQSRDVLLCQYKGNFALFKDQFLCRAAQLLRRLRATVRTLRKTQSRCELIEDRKFCITRGSHLACSACGESCEEWTGWPFRFKRQVVIHIAELDSSLLRPGDFYFHLKDFETAGSGVCSLTSDLRLTLKYRSANGFLEQRLDDHDFGCLIAMEQLRTANSCVVSDDQLPDVLQHLLVSVERGIERLEWDGVSIPPPRCCRTMAHPVDTRDTSVQTVPEELPGSGSKACEGLATSKESCDHCQASVIGMQNGGNPLGNAESGELCRGKLRNFDQHSLNDDSKQTSNESEVTLRLCSPLPIRDEDPDDGYYEHTLVQPTTISQVEPDILHSEIALLPGSRDMCGRSVVIIRSSAVKDYPSMSPCHLAQLILYFHTIPKKEVVSRGFLILVEAEEHNEEFWNILDEAFCLLESNTPGIISRILLWLKNDDKLDVSKLLTSTPVQCELICTLEMLQNFIERDQILTTHGGTYLYDHQEWISFRKFLEPFIHGCRISGRHLVSLLEELRSSRLPLSSSLTHQMIEQQKRNVNQTFRDEQLRHLEEEGDTILRELESYRTKSPHNADYRENLERTTVLYNELRKAITKLARLADKRLDRLEECLQMRTFQEESSQVLSWLCRKGTESLEKHQAVADSLGAIKQQEEEFEKFYFLAMIFCQESLDLLSNLVFYRLVDALHDHFLKELKSHQLEILRRQIEKGNDLLEEVSMLDHEMCLSKIQEESPADEGGMQELAASLRHHLGSFSEKLEVTRERLEDTAKCYQLMDMAYEWALDAMRFVSRMGIDNTGNVDGLSQQIRCLQEYLEERAPVSEDTFQEMLELASKLGNERLVEQCKVAKLRCQETVELILARQAHLLKARQQIEVDSFRGPLWDNEDSTPVPRTIRSHSQPTNTWTPSVTSTPFPLNIVGHQRRRSVSTAAAAAPQRYGSPIGSYTSFPSSYYPTAKEPYLLDSYIHDKDEHLLQHGLITEDLTYQGPVASISKSVLDSRVLHREGPPSSASSSSSSSTCSSKGAINILRSSGRGVNSTVANMSRWAKKHTRRSQTWQLRDDALEKVKAEVREQNALLRVERVNLPQDESNDSIHSSELELSPSTETCKLSLSHTRSDPVRGPVPVNTHLLSQVATADLPDGEANAVDAANNAEMKSKKTLKLIMKEMVQTERDYVKSLEYIIESYIPELLREDIPQALRGQRNVIFGNIEKIYEFHSQYFLNELEQCEGIPFSAGQCFLNYEPQFYLYALYNKNKPKSDALTTEYGSTFFRKKQLELGDKMDLASYLLKPVQRMGKYALLLKQLLKECPEREAEHHDLKAAEEMVRFQLRHGNDLLAMDALRDCDVNVKEQGRLLRQDEFLVWQGRSRKSLRHIFFFEDLILFSKARRDPERKGHEVYQYKHSMKTTDMGLTEQVGDSPTKFEIWFRKRKLNDTYVLQAPTPEIKVAWVHELSKLLWKQALRNREMRLAEMSSMGIGNKPCLDIKPSDDQISDRSISIHQLARAPRFRNSIASSPCDVRINRRPQSIISVSSSSSSGSSQSSFTFYGTLNLGFEPGDSPRPLHRSLTQQSQCSTESGFCTDASTAGDSPVDSEQTRHKKAERSDSLLSSDSLSISVTPSDLGSPCEDEVPEEGVSTSM